MSQWHLCEWLDLAEKTHFASRPGSLFTFCSHCQSDSYKIHADPCNSAAFHFKPMNGSTLKKKKTIPKRDLAKSLDEAYYGVKTKMKQKSERKK